MWMIIGMLLVAIILTALTIIYGDEENLISAIKRILQPSLSSGSNGIIKEIGKLTTQENIDIINELMSIYPNKLKIIKSKNDEETINISVWVDAEKRDFDNTDYSEMPNFVSEQLSLDKEVAILLLERSKLRVCVAKGVFKK